VLDHGLAAVEAACAEALEAGYREWRCDPDRAGAPAAARGARPASTTPDALRLTIEPAADCGRYDRHKENRLMERHEILEAMSELKLYGMRASFDEIAG